MADAMLKALHKRRVVARNTATLIADLNRTRVRTVLADLELALTFTDIAATSENVEVRNRNTMNARTAFFTIRDQLLPRCSLDESQQAEIYGKLQELRSRLEEFGEYL